MNQIFIAFLFFLSTQSIAKFIRPIKATYPSPWKNVISSQPTGGVPVSYIVHPQYQSLKLSHTMMEFAGDDKCLAHDPCLGSKATEEFKSSNLQGCVVKTKSSWKLARYVWLADKKLCQFETLDWPSTPEDIADAKKNKLVSDLFQYFTVKGQK